MATETLVPDVLEALTNLSGTVGDVDNGIATPGTWLAEGDDALNTVARVEFPTPTGNPTTGSGLQKFRIWCRRSVTAGGNDPTLDVWLYENNADTVGAALSTGTSITSTSGELVEATWDAADLGTADGSLVELHVIGQRSGGSPTSRRTVEFDEFEWVVDYTAAGAGSPECAMNSFRQMRG